MDNNIINNNSDYAYLIEKFGAKKIASRYDWVSGLLFDYISKRQCQNRVVISEDILRHVIIDYFVDIDRLKAFQGIEFVHTSKIYAYIGFWLLRHKVIQVIEHENAADLAFINEEFVCHFIRSYLFSKPESVVVLSNEPQTCVDDFVNTMFYYFQYREYSAKNIELMILAFQAGRGYQYSADHQR